MAEFEKEEPWMVMANHPPEGDEECETPHRLYDLDSTIEFYKSEIQRMESITKDPTKYIIPENATKEPPGLDALRLRLKFYRIAKSKGCTHVWV